MRSRYYLLYLANRSYVRLSALLLYIAAIWAAAGVARAQLYVSQEVQKPFIDPGIGKYNSTTGAVINANLLASVPMI
jgi:hypothetical protein